MNRSAPPEPTPRRRDRLQVAIIVNQLATPGLGSWVAGRRVAGAGQLTLACIGFGLYVVYFVLLLRGLVRATFDGIPALPPPAGWWKSALGLFGLAWLWSGITSLQLLAEIRARRNLPPPAEPPRL